MSLTDLLSAVGCLFGISGIILAVYFYLKSRRKKRLLFDTRTFGLLSDATASIPGFHASFCDHELKTLTASKILLWNSGTEIIEGSELQIVILSHSNYQTPTRYSWQPLRRCPTQPTMCNWFLHTTRGTFFRSHSITSRHDKVASYSFSTAVVRMHLQYLGGPSRERDHHASTSRHVLHFG